MMDLALIIQHLSQAERHVANGEGLLERQRAMIEQLRRDGHGTTHSEDLLGQLESAQASLVEARDRLSLELRSARLVTHAGPEKENPAT